MKIEGVGQEAGGSMDLVRRVNEGEWLLSAMWSSPYTAHRRRISTLSGFVSAFSGGSSLFLCHDHSSEWWVAGLTMLGLPISCQIQPMAYNSVSDGYGDFNEQRESVLPAHFCLRFYSVLGALHPHNLLRCFQKFQ